MSDRAVAGSFRDPSGYLFEHDGTLYRFVAPSFRAHVDRLIESGLYAALVDEGLLIPHVEVDPASVGAPGAYKVIRPERVGFISYPYEWCFSQLKDAALTTLRIQARALELGMSLRDASAYNIQFHRGRPVLIDTLSFEILPEGMPWVAYNQFCRHFLAPLALAHYRDARLSQLARVHIDGVPLDLASSLLPRHTRWMPSTAIHIHAHARSQARAAAANDPATATGDARADSRRPFSRRAFAGVIESLRAAVSKLRWEPPKSVWTTYYATCDHYTDAAIARKRDLVTAFLEQARPGTVWDVGANTGAFSRLASSRGIPTVAFEMDAGCVEANYRTARETGETSILPLVCDLTNPSPSLGWAGAERASLAERGPADLVMALALIHHLAIGNNVPLGRVAAYLRTLGARLIVEWVPKSDPKVRTLLASREDVFDDYTRAGFEQAFGAHFAVERVEEIAGTDRVLYLMRGLGG